MHQKVIALARKLGAKVTVERDENFEEITVDAPNGQHWIDGTVHQLVYHQRRGKGAWTLAEGWEEVYKRMLEGLEECTPETNTDCADNAIDC